MPKRLMVESRFQWRGGLNTAQNADELQVDELVEAKNTRLTTPHGALAKRSGSRRMHANSLGADIRGLYQWDAPAGKEVVCVDSFGNFQHKTNEYGEFTQETASLTAPTRFVTFRDTSASAALVLYMAGANGNVYSWDGTTLTKIDGTNSVPNADLLAVYHTRVFARDIDLKKHVFWSKVGTGADFTTGGLTDGGSAIVDILTGEEIVAMETVGSSLAIGTEDSIVRFTGYASNDIRVEQDTEGISAMHGPVGPRCMVRCEEMLAVLTDRGPYLVDESGVAFIGQKVEDQFRDLDSSQIADACIGYHRGRREIWFAVPRSGDTGNQSVYVYSLTLSAWYGPFTYSFAITELARYEDPNGNELLIGGCDDGRVRLMDYTTSRADDILSDDTGGSGYETVAELAPIFFETGPAVLKSLKRLMISGYSGAHAVSFEYAFDTAAWAATDAFLLGESGEGAPNVPETERVDVYGQGRRLRLRWRHSGTATNNVLVIHGLQVFAYDMLRSGI